MKITNGNCMGDRKQSGISAKLGLQCYTQN